MRVLVLTNMFPTDSHPALGTFVFDQVASLRALGVDVDVLFLDPGETRLNYLKGLVRLRRRIHAKRYEVIHAHYVFCGVIAVTQRRVPVVLTHHGIEVLTLWTPRLARWVSRKVDLTIVTSREMADRLPGAPLVIPCGVDLDLFKPMPRDEARRKLGLPQDGTLILFAGEPRREKRLDVLKGAAENLKRRGLPVELVIVSRQPHGQMPLWMNACDVLALVSDYEGSPMVIKEAMACGVPVVSTKVGDVAEVIGDTQGCFLCLQEIGDVATKLQEALALGGRTEGRRRMGDFDLARIASRLVGVYEQVRRSRR